MAIITWDRCRVCWRMYRSGEACVGCPGFAAPINTYEQGRWDATYHDGEAIDVLLPVLPTDTNPGDRHVLTAEYFGVENIHDGDTLMWAPEFKPGLLVLSPKLRCHHADKV